MMNKMIFLMLLACLLAVSEAKVTTAAEALLAEMPEGIMQENNGRMWQLDKSKRFKSKEDAEQYLIELNHGKYNDWRLPTKDELYDLFVIFDLRKNGEVKISIEGNYWLDDDGVYAGAWEIADGCGPARNFFKKKAGYVRAVRP